MRAQNILRFGFAVAYWSCASGCRPERAQSERPEASGSENNARVTRESGVSQSGENRLPLNLNTADKELLLLREDAMTGKTDRKYRARGRILALLDTGMTRKDLEIWLGKADSERVSSSKERMALLYHCERLGERRVDLMAVEIEKRGGDYYFTKVTGPYNLDE